MVEAGRIDGAAPAGAEGAARAKPSQPGARGAFAEELTRARGAREASAPPAAAAAGSTVEDRVRAAAASQGSGQVLEVSLLRRYSPLERDAALYEARTEQGLFRVILGRDGGLTVFRA
jgi:hypothetical protein